MAVLEVLVWGVPIGLTPTISIDDPIAGDNVVSSAEAVALIISGATTNVESGQTVTVRVEDSTSAEIFADTTTVQVDPRIWTLTADLSGILVFDDSSYTVTADVSAVSGIAAERAARAIVAQVPITISIDDPPVISSQTLDSVDLDFTVNLISGSPSSMVADLLRTDTTAVVGTQSITPIPSSGGSTVVSFTGVDAIDGTTALTFQLRVTAT